jgi:hypothetical protein
MRNKEDYGRLRYMRRDTSGRETLLQPTLHISHLKQRSKGINYCMYPDWWGHEEYIPEITEEHGLKARPELLAPAGLPPTPPIEPKKFIDVPIKHNMTDEITQTKSGKVRDFDTIAIKPPTLKQHKPRISVPRQSKKPPKPKLNFFPPEPREFKFEYKNNTTHPKSQPITTEYNNSADSFISLLTPAELENGVFYIVEKFLKSSVVDCLDL